jgi:pilus assembly protein Flp/PilA
MRNAFLKVFVKGQVMLASLKDESGQDLIEYALVVALIAFAATAGMKTLANGINLAFTNIASTLSTNIT